ncbi:NAD(P)-binding protein [Aureobasidium sp. EXF-10728]|nr:NAD(P)-binding protein [Aureobasidium sp. EXF-10728]
MNIPTLPQTLGITILTKHLYPTILTLIPLSILYTLTLPPLPSSLSLNLDSLLHVCRILFPPLTQVYSLCVGYVLCTLTLYSFIPVVAVLVAGWYTLLYAVVAINTRLGYGPRRAITWSEQIAVVTGGAGGLGWLIAQILQLRGATVVVWDIQPPQEYAGDAEGGVQWYKVDVGQVEQVESAYEKVKNDVGTPTILINNAGIVNGQPLLSLSANAISRCFQINTLSHFHTCRTFLPGFLSSPQGGTIVTVSSVLGHLGASHLTDYTASKAALLAFHTSLRAEIAQLQQQQQYPGAKNTKMVLVKPGQLSTNMFSSLKSPSEFFGPVVQAKDLAMAVVDMIGEGRDGVVCMPVYAALIEWLGVLPVGMQRVARWMSGVDGAMRTFGSKRE